MRLAFSRTRPATLDMALGRLVEGGGDDLALTIERSVGDLFGALVHQDDHEVHLGVVQLDGLGHLLDDHRLAGLGRGNDEAALPLAHGATRSMTRGVKALGEVSMRSCSEG